MGPRRTYNSFKTITEVIEKEKDFAKLRESLKNYDLVDEFEKMFPELGQIAKAVKVDKGILFLRVENSVWKSELNFQKNLLIEKINNRFNDTVIKSIKFL